MLTEKKEANFFVNNYFRKKNFIIKFLKGEGPKYTYGNLLQRNDRPSDKFQKSICNAFSTSQKCYRETTGRVINFKKVSVYNAVSTSQKWTNPWAQDVNWKYIRRSTYVLFPGVYKWRFQRNSDF